MDAFPRGTVLMNELMARLMDAAKRVPALREKLYQANFHTTLSGQAMVRETRRLIIHFTCAGDRLSITQVFDEMCLEFSVTHTISRGQI